MLQHGLSVLSFRQCDVATQSKSDPTPDLRSDPRAIPFSIFFRFVKAFLGRVNMMMPSSTDEAPVALSGVKWVGNGYGMVSAKTLLMKRFIVCLYIVIFVKICQCCY